jgi:hypothetical protein
VVRTHLSLVFAAGGGAGHPERLQEPAGSETPLLKEKASFMPFATTPCSLRYWELGSGFHHRILRFVIFFVLLLLMMMISVFKCKLEFQKKKLVYTFYVFLNIFFI